MCKVKYSEGLGWDEGDILYKLTLHIYIPYWQNTDTLLIFDVFGGVWYGGWEGRSKSRYCV